MATNNSKLNVVAVGASAGGVEAPQTRRLAEHVTPGLLSAVVSDRLSEVYRRDRGADE